jgi:hypothetical protein
MNLEQDLNVINSVNEFREQSGLRKANNPYPWFVSVMVALTYYKTQTTLRSVLTDLESIGITISPTCVNNWKKVALGEERDPYRRNYAFRLPGIAMSCGLGLGTPQKPVGRGKAADTYFLKNRQHAKNVLLTIFPNTNLLFNLLDKKKF